MNNEIVKHAVNQIFKWIAIIGGGALIIGFLVGMYFLEHYRWGSCR